MANYFEDFCAKFDGIEVECMDNGAVIDLGEEMLAMYKAGYDIPTEYDPRKVRWYSHMPEEDRGEGENYDGAWWSVSGWDDAEWDDDDPLNPEYAEFQELNKVMTAAEVAEEFSLAEATVRQAINRKQIKARKSGGTWLVLRSTAQEKWGERRSKVDEK